MKLIEIAMFGNSDVDQRVKISDTGLKTCRQT